MPNPEHTQEEREVAARTVVSDGVSNSFMLRAETKEMIVAAWVGGEEKCTVHNQFAIALQCSLTRALKSLSERDQQIASMLVTAEHSEKLVDGLLKQVQEARELLHKYMNKGFMLGPAVAAWLSRNPSPSAPKEAQDG